MEWVKRKYTFRTILYLLLLVVTAVIIFFTIYRGRTILFLIAFSLLAVLFLGLFYYNAACYVLLHKKCENYYETKVDRDEYFANKKVRKEKNIAVFDVVFKYMLYISPFVVALLIIFGAFVVKNILFTLVIPAIVIILILVFFFFKEVYENTSVEENEVIIKETVFANDNVVCYDGVCYIYKGFGFKFKENKHTFLNIKFSTLAVKEEDIKEKVMGIINEVRD